MPKRGPTPKITIPQAEAALRRSGYLLEARVESILEQREFYVETNTAYPDTITGKSREVDLYAMSAMVASKDFDVVYYIFVIECVNNSQPIAFITKEPALPQFQHHALKMAGIPVQIAPETKHDDWIPLVEFFKMPDYHHYSSGRIATQFCSFAQKKGADDRMALHETVHFDAFSKVCEATDHYREEYIASWQSDPTQSWSRSSRLNLEIYYPVVVLEGDLLDVRPSANRLDIKSAKHIVHKHTTIERGEVAEYYIDVLTEEFLPDYVDLVAGEIQKTVNRIRRHKKRIELSVGKILKKGRATSDSTAARKLLLPWNA